jgi:hypothetical protein
MIRSQEKEENIMLCYAPPMGASILKNIPLASTAMDAHGWFHRASRDPYWIDVFRDVTDPSFALLPLFWYIVYAWGEALETLYLRINTLVNIPAFVCRTSAETSL